MKKVLGRSVALLLAVVTILSFCVSASALEPRPAYGDIAGGSWYEKYCNAVSETGIMNGTGDGKFSPLTECNRAMFVTILYRLAGSPAVKAASTMTDVVAGSWYADSVAWAQETGVTTGYADGTFGVTGILSRQQMVTFLHRFAKYMGKDVSKMADISKYADSASVQSWAKDAVSWAVGEGVIQGTAVGLEPNTACNRAMAATVISRMNGLVQENVTRADLEAALQETAWTYFTKGKNIQYCGRTLNSTYTQFYGGVWRIQLYGTPEDATSDYELFSVCSDYCYSVYENAMKYPLFGARVNTSTLGAWRLSSYPQEMALIRWASSAYNNGTGTFSEADAKNHLTDNTKLSSLDTTMAFLKDYEKNLRPGDILTVRTSSGHSMMYIGGGYVLDANGTSYDLAAGADKREANGTVSVLRTMEDLYLKADPVWPLQEYEAKGTAAVFNVIRPLDNLVIADGDNDPSNDKLNTAYVLPNAENVRYDVNTAKSGYNITNATRSRMKYPAMEIDRTVNRTPYGATFTGDTLTYSVKISNKSNNDSYKAWKSAVTGASYAGETYKALVVKETIPAGTELISVPTGATLNGRTLTWTVDIAAGEVKDLTYSVKVTAKRGEKIVATGGWVDKIPSNTIENVVGGAKLSAEKLAALSEFAKAGPAKWNSNEGYKISAKSTGTKFGMRIYNEAMGLDLKLPDAQELLDNLFEPVHIQEEHGFGTYYDKSIDTWMYKFRQTAPAGYQAIKDMVIDTYVGGDVVFTDRYNGEKRINSFRTDYLEPGDIIIHGMLSAYAGSAKRTVESTNIIVYLGDSTYAILGSDGAMTTSNKETAIWQAHSQDFFVALRPSQGYADINTEVKAYDKSKSPELTKDDANTAVDIWSQEGLKAGFAGITESSWSGARKPVNQRSFGLWVYQIAGIDLTGILTQNISYTIGNNNDTGLFEKVDGKFALQSAPADAYAGEKKMLIEGAFDGKNVAAGNAAAFSADSNFLIGDMIFGYKKIEGDHKYFSAIKVADNSWFFGNGFEKTTCGKQTFNGVMKTLTDGNAEIYYALRPSQAVAEK